MEQRMFAMTTLSNCYNSRDKGDTLWWDSLEHGLDYTEKGWKSLIRRSADNAAAKRYREYLKPTVKFFKSKEAFIKAYTKATGNKPNIEEY